VLERSQKGSNMLSIRSQEMDEERTRHTSGSPHGITKTSSHTKYCAPVTLQDSRDNKPTQVHLEYGRGGLA